MARTDAPSTPQRLAAGAEFHRALRRACVEARRGTPQALFSIGIPRLADVRALCGERAEVALIDLILLTAQNLLGPIEAVGLAEGGYLLLVAPRCAPNRAPESAARLRLALQGGVFRWWGRHFRLGVSISVRALPPRPDRVADLVEQMLAAARAAERLGGSGVVRCPTSAAEWSALARVDGDREHIATVL